MKVGTDVKVGTDAVGGGCGRELGEQPYYLTHAQSFLNFHSQ